MKEPTLLDNKNNPLNIANLDEPLHCMQNSEQAEHILDVTSAQANIPDTVAKLKHLSNEQKKLAKSFNKG